MSPIKAPVKAPVKACDVARCGQPKARCKERPVNVLRVWWGISTSGQRYRQVCNAPETMQGQFVCGSPTALRFHSIRPAPAPQNPSVRLAAHPGALFHRSVRRSQFPHFHQISALRSGVCRSGILRFRAVPGAGRGWDRLVQTLRAGPQTAPSPAIATSMVRSARSAARASRPRGGLSARPRRRRPWLCPGRARCANAGPPGPAPP